MESKRSPPITNTPPVKVASTISLNPTVEFSGIALSKSTTKIGNGIYEHEVTGQNISVHNDTPDLIPLEFNFNNVSLLSPEEILNAQQLLTDTLPDWIESSRIIDGVLVQQWIENSILTLKPIYESRSIYVTQSEFQLIRRCLGYKELTKYVSLGDSPLVMFTELSESIEVELQRN